MLCEDLAQKCHFRQAAEGLWGPGTIDGTEPPIHILSHLLSQLLLFALGGCRKRAISNRWTERSNQSGSRLAVRGSGSASAITFKAARMLSPTLSRLFKARDFCQHRRRIGARLSTCGSAIRAFAPPTTDWSQHQLFGSMLNQPISKVCKDCRIKAFIIQW
jgi:hypothetical protein